MRLDAGGKSGRAEGNLKVVGMGNWTDLIVCVCFFELGLSIGDTV